ncbi:hypothetical protein BCR32DRAFT_295708 [Anaeromyces robustus]|uniref:N-acetyltransferase domain-containing protein n=1 Tax=Anaeromyces robustus TaxID=1754192 RepID=A0A1Y1WVF9_9FUNG|nr:hypothetical protein BCR32DRAFT_295708 [Anaeromyces robustus]|eukprot:ORX77288.1 hypothetical protein BCR32DRAFT_295708 [Anaeromyces robustus]
MSDSCIYFIQFPYNINELTWNETHTRNEENIYCYCGKNITENESYIKCQECRQIFHSSCVKVLKYPQLIGDIFYIFKCSVCSKGKEIYKRTELNWINCIQLVIYNIIKQKNEISNNEHNKNRYCQFQEDIYTFINNNWEYFYPNKTRPFNLKDIIQNVLVSNPNIFSLKKDEFQNIEWWSLKSFEIPKFDKIDESKIIKEDFQINTNEKETKPSLDKKRNSTDIEDKNNKEFIPYIVKKQKLISNDNEIGNNNNKNNSSNINNNISKSIVEDQSSNSTFTISSSELTNLSEIETFLSNNSDYEDTELINKECIKETEEIKNNSSGINKSVEIITITNENDKDENNYNNKEKTTKIIIKDEESTETISNKKAFESITNGQNTEILEKNKKIAQIIVKESKKIKTEDNKEIITSKTINNFQSIENKSKQDSIIEKETEKDNEKLKSKNEMKNNIKQEILDINSNILKSEHLKINIKDLSKDIILNEELDNKKNNASEINEIENINTNIIKEDPLNIKNNKNKDEINNVNSDNNIVVTDRNDNILKSTQENININKKLNENLKANINKKLDENININIKLNETIKINEQKEKNINLDENINENINEKSNENINEKINENINEKMNENIDINKKLNENNNKSINIPDNENNLYYDNNNIIDYSYNNRNVNKNDYNVNSNNMDNFNLKMGDKIINDTNYKKIDNLLNNISNQEKENKKISEVTQLITTKNNQKINEVYSLSNDIYQAEIFNNNNNNDFTLKNEINNQIYYKLQKQRIENIEKKENYNNIDKKLKEKSHSPKNIKTEVLPNHNKINSNDDNILYKNIYNDNDDQISFSDINSSNISLELDEKTNNYFNNNLESGTDFSESSNFSNNNSNNNNNNKEISHPIHGRKGKQPRKGKGKGLYSGSKSIISKNNSDFKEYQSDYESISDDDSSNDDISKNKIPKAKNIPIMTLEKEYSIMKQIKVHINSSKDARRLYRKLQLRKIKRAGKNSIFNIDNLMKNYLSSKIELTPINKIKFKRNNIVSIKKTPYKNSFKSRLYGKSLDLNHTLDIPVISKYTGIKLMPYIYRNYDIKPPKLKLLEDIITYYNRNNPKWQRPKSAPIDFVHLQKEHIDSVNDMLCHAFWPGINISEQLMFPDFSIIAMYKRLIIGCAFITPEAYITYIYVRPDWGNSGIGKFMLYYLIQSCIGKDITLHVSANNKAMLMYQKFGFKAEEFNMNFYEKYLPPDSIECKNAFLLRLRR